MNEVITNPETSQVDSLPEQQVSAKELELQMKALSDLLQVCDAFGNDDQSLAIFEMAKDPHPAELAHKLTDLEPATLEKLQDLNPAKV